MIITYFRSSSYTKWDYCPHSYFLNYVLGIQEASNKKAEMGTIVHKVMECLAAAKLCQQNKEDEFTDDAIGKVKVDYEYMYTNAFVDWLIHKSYGYYTEKSRHHFTKGDFKKCYTWSHIALTELNGGFDPRKREIVSPELQFDFEIKEPWAEYEYTTPQGEKIEGRLALKGTIDLITKEMDDPLIYESLDWKTGRRLDWANFTEKTYEKFAVDPQLRIYHLALTHEFPKVEQFIPTIFWIRDGGAFTLPFGPKDIDATLKMLRKRFELIKNNVRPPLNRSFVKCNRICHYGKTEHESKKINTTTGQPLTICDYYSQKIRDCGINQVMQEDTVKGHDYSYYQNPGE